MGFCKNAYPSQDGSKSRLQSNPVVKNLDSSYAIRIATSDNTAIYEV